MELPLLVRHRWAKFGWRTGSNPDVVIIARRGDGDSGCYDSMSRDEMAIGRYRPVLTAWGSERLG